MTIPSINLHTYTDTDTVPMSFNPAIDHTISVVTAFVGKQAISLADLPKLVADTFKAVTALYGPPQPTEQPKGEPAVPLKKAVTHDAIFCVECGYKGKSLRRHLNVAHGLTPEQYNAKWGFPVGHPVVSPAYSEARSALAKAKANGLGKKGR